MKKIVLLFMAAIVLPTISFAQCAMCRATAESATENVDKGIGEGLNDGIVYLMILPYLLLIISGTVFFRKRIAAFLK
ncbi:MAG: hypothetical protein ACKOSR_02030 [Flavobacteriales bacterium]|jgi:hypothetical protein